ncbi:condensin subunit Smc [Geothermobacter ehrlichii]|uniref:Chromosome partition protein Smc n=1 Tax=Geothermobacter ehrlichii TaxID=213224 RepID=A0A5D3WJF2_9BACT|nr:chromosome segregation protein SMC [Geothermobacter ehrlichii]TYO98318.1 condensin subunit Smc [Geothermobacter ehrlichii]
MRIKRLEIIGFKSFVDKVEIDFQDGVTAIVGPNGCGKSNIVDAIRWAMGEQSARNLRGKSMEDVIFNGSETRKPHGMAEVSLIFDNEDGLAPPAFAQYAEIMVTRRLYRSGESEYLLNKTPCRLLDIAELFMDTGVGRRAYSIIEQGKIGFILNAKPEERRFLIEEAAGVTKFKARKKTAIRKIDATRQNLLRLGDIISEVNRQLASLKRQANKAERYRRYREELKGIETRFALRRFRQLTAEIAELEKGEREGGGVLERLGGELQVLEMRLDEGRLQQAGLEKELGRIQEQVFHLTAEIQQAEGRISFARQQREKLELQKERRAAESEEVRQRLVALDDEEEALERTVDGLAGELAEAEARLAEAAEAAAEWERLERRRNAQLEETRQKLYTLMSGLSRLQNQQQDARRRLELQDERKARNRREAAEIQEELARVQQEAQERSRRLEEDRQRHSGLRQEQERVREELDGWRARRTTNEEELLTAREDLNRVRSRLESLRQLEADLEGYAGGVRTLLADDGLKSRLGGLVADHLGVPRELETAVEAVLGERLQALLADSGDAEAAFALLRQKGGRATLLLGGPQPAGVPAWSEGKHLAELVETADDARLRGLLTGVYLVEDVRPWLGRTLPFGVTLVTRDGDTLTGRGEWTGGSAPAAGGGLLHKKREIRELADRLAGLERRVEELEAERQQLHGRCAEGEERLQELAAAIHRQELRLVDSDKDLARFRQEEERLLQRIEVLSLEEDQLHGDREHLQRLLQEATDGLRQQEEERQRLEAEIEELTATLAEQRREQEQARERLTRLRVEVASLKEREAAARSSREGLEQLRHELQGRLAVLAGEREDATAEQRRLQQEAESLQQRLEVLFARREEEKKKYDRQRDRFEETAQQLLLEEDRLRELRQQVNRVREEVGGLQLQLREKQLALEHLRQSFLDRYRLDLNDLEEVEDEPEIDQQAAERRLEELKRLIEGIGEVNLTAIDEYRELEERARFLLEQQEDLRQSLHGLQTAIAKINRTTRKRFRETFDQVNAKFQEVFPRLFQGGRAELRLTDEDDLLETGIDIIAQPPGKKLQGVTLLSGGEKALTAVALIFAIFLIKPSPFCLLDEVDAPLDEANIGRFNEMVKEMSALSQFIIITHNKRTMEMADTLYGVTMQEPGVSRLVSVRINEF